MKELLNKINKENSLKWFKVSFFVLLLIFYGYLVTYKIPLPAAEDLPRQMANGRDMLNGDFRTLTQNLYSYTQTDHYFANHHWLYGVFTYVLQGIVGWSGLVIFKILFILTTFSILFITALRKADFWLVALASVPAILMLSGRSDLRPELFGYFFITLYIYLLYKLEENPNSKVFYYFIISQILWANLHITFPMGVMVVGGFLLEKVLLGIKKPFYNQLNLGVLRGIFIQPLVKKLSFLLIILSIVSFMNPLGIKGVIYSLTANIGHEAPLVSSEVQRLDSVVDDIPKYASLSLALVVPSIFLLAGSFVLGRKKKEIMYFLGSVGAGLLSYYVIRGVPFLGIFFLLAFTANINDIFLKFKNWILEKISIPKIKLEFIIGILVFSVFFVFLFLNQANLSTKGNEGIGLSKNSEDAIKFFKDNNLKGPIFNDTDIGSYLIYYLYPGEKVYSDNRFGDAYSDEFFQKDYVDAITDDTKWQETMDKYQFNTMIFYQYDNGHHFRDFIFKRMRDPQWVFVYGDRFTVILVRKTVENMPVINKYGITIENAQERFRSLTKDLNADDLVAVADLYALMGQHGWALANYEVAMSQRPDWAKIWFVMGQMELQKGDQKNSNPALAALFLEQAVARGWDTPNAYSFLALAYFRMGQIEKAKEAVAKELKINPKSKDALIWQKNFKEYEIANTINE